MVSNKSTSPHLGIRYSQLKLTSLPKRYVILSTPKKRACQLYILTPNPHGFQLLMLVHLSYLPWTLGLRLTQTCKRTCFFYFFLVVLFCKLCDNLTKWRWLKKKCTQKHTMKWLQLRASGHKTHAKADTGDWCSPVSYQALSNHLMHAGMENRH